VDLAATTTDLALRADTLSDLAEVLATTGSREAARASAAEALSLYELKGDTTSAGRCRSRLVELNDVVVVD
jgi:hypothetical protein